MRWAWHVVSTGGKRNIQGSCGKDPLGRPSRRWSLILKWILRKQGRKMWTSFIWLRIGIGGVLFGQGNDISCCIKCGEFLD